MRVALLTTQTSHHLYFAKAIHRDSQLAAILIETVATRPPFETAHAFEAQRDEFERSLLIADDGLAFDALAETRLFSSANDSAAVDWLASKNADVVLVFGTGRLTATTLKSARLLLNFHGGNPEDYRGLDSHLWTIYHRDFTNLVTTLHRMDVGLDTGDIVLQAPVPLEKDMPLYKLRSANTRACVTLAINALRGIERGHLPGRPQSRRGRYYSFMPTVLKEDCLRKFTRYTASL